MDVNYDDVKWLTGRNRNKAKPSFNVLPGLCPERIEERMEDGTYTAGQIRLHMHLLI